MSKLEQFLLPTSLSRLRAETVCDLFMPVPLFPSPGLGTMLKKHM